jgi:cell wall-associated NlpC family hydrolase
VDSKAWSDAESLLRTALGLRGVRYRFGGADPEGFDCSGFTQYVFGRHGLALPREAGDQFRSGTPVDRGNLAPGDLLFFTTTAPGPTHVAIALDAHQFVHAPNSRGVVRIERLDARHWSQRYIGARRVQLR